MQLRFLWRGMKAYFRDERCELRQLVAGLQPTDIVVDVGANKGSYLWALSRAVPRGRVVAFEPQPELAEYLRGAVASNGLRNVLVEQQGVSDHRGELLLAIPENKAAAAGATFEVAKHRRPRVRTIPVAITSLDEYFAGEKVRVGAIKIDVEGHELAVLRGAKELLRRAAPVIVCECDERNVAGGKVEALFEIMAELRYQGEFIQRQRLKPVAEFNPSVHQARHGKRYWKHPDYCYNFVFRRAA